MNYSTIKNVLYGLLWMVFALFMNATKNNMVDFFTDFENLSAEDIHNAIIFLLSFTAIILLAVNKYFSVRKIERKKQLDLYPYFTKRNIKEDTRNYVQTQIQNIPPSQEDEPIMTHAIAIRHPALPFFINTVFNSEDHRYYLILAGSGMGKTTFLINLYIRYVNKFKQKYNIKLIPLNNLDGLSDIDLLSQEQKSNTILLLDSLDEDPKAIIDYNLRLEEIMKKVWRFRKVIITCRTQFFPDEKEEPHEILIANSHGGNFHFKKIYISPFDLKDCKIYLRKKFGWLPNKKKKRSIRILIDAQKIMIRPMLLSRIDDLLRGNKEYDLLYKIYEQIVESWIEREGEKRIDIQLNKDKFKESLRVFSEKIALHIYRNWRSQNIALVSKKDIYKLAKENSIELDNWELTGKSLLNRDANGNWKFAHKSIWEFFIADIFSKYESLKKEIQFTGLDFAKKLYNEVNLSSFFRQFEKAHGLFMLKNEELIIYDSDSDSDSGLADAENLNEFIDKYMYNIEYNLLKRLYIHSPISNVYGLRVFTGLEELELKSLMTKDLEVLRNITTLKTLNISSSSNISDVMPLKNLTNLTSLSISSSSNIDDIKPLKNLTNLISLNIGLSLVNSNLDVLATFRKLKYLCLNSVEELNDISALNSLRSLTSLELSGPKIKNISALNDLTNLRKLTISNVGLDYLPVLESLKFLHELTIKSTNLSFLTELKNLNFLRILELPSIYEKSLGVVVLKQYLTSCEIRFHSYED